MIVVTHRGATSRSTCCAPRMAAAGAAHAEWLVVDSGSTDGTPDAIERSYPDVTVLRRPNIGFAAANNVGLRSRRGRYVLLLNPDVEIVDGTLAELVAAMDARSRGRRRAARSRYYPDGELQASIRRFPSPTRQLGEALMLTRLPSLPHLTEDESRPEAYEREQSADWLSGSFLLARQRGGRSRPAASTSASSSSPRRPTGASASAPPGGTSATCPTLRLTHHTGRTDRPDLFAQNSYSKVLYARKHFRLPARTVVPRRAGAAPRRALDRPRRSRAAPAGAQRARRRRAARAARRARVRAAAVPALRRARRNLILMARRGSSSLLERVRRLQRLLGARRTPALPHAGDQHRGDRREAEHDDERARRELDPDPAVDDGAVRPPELLEADDVSLRRSLLAGRVLEVVAEALDRALASVSAVLRSAPGRRSAGSGRSGWTGC